MHCPDTVSHSESVEDVRERNSMIQEAHMKRVLFAGMLTLAALGMGLPATFAEASPADAYIRVVTDHHGRLARAHHRNGHHREHHHRRVEREHRG
jgi:hypothetical protein